MLFYLCIVPTVVCAHDILLRTAKMAVPTMAASSSSSSSSSLIGSVTQGSASSVASATQPGALPTPTLPTLPINGDPEFARLCKLLVTRSSDLDDTKIISHQDGQYTVSISPQDDGTTALPSATPLIDLSAPKQKLLPFDG